MNKFEAIEYEICKMLDRARCEWRKFITEKLENYNEELTLPDIHVDVTFEGEKRESFYILTQQNTLEDLETGSASDFVSNQDVDKNKIGLALQSERDEDQRSCMEQSRGRAHCAPPNSSYIQKPCAIRVKLTIEDLLKDAVPQKFEKKVYYIEIIYKGGTQNKMLEQ